MAVFARTSIAPAEVSSAEDSRAYIVDFVCHERMLVIELDGGQHGFAGRCLAGEPGSRVLRFWNDDVLARREVVLEVILVL